MAADIGRRQFISALGGAAIGWPLPAHAQQPAKPEIGFLHSLSPNAIGHQLEGFHEGLNETGYIEGQNVVVESRWADGQYDRLPALAADLVRLRVNVIVAGGGAVTAAAAPERQLLRFQLSSRMAMTRSEPAWWQASIDQAAT
jgi:putative ABC transport system substrate-binding protein